MNWDTIKPGLKTLIANLSGLNALWFDEPRDFVDPATQAVALIAPVSAVGIGRDECRILYDPGQPLGFELQDEWSGLRRLTITIRVESQLQTDTGAADQYLERIREKLPFRSTQAALEGFACAFVRALDTVDLGQTRDQRKASIRAFDLVLTARTVTLDPERYPYIGEVETPTGTLLPS